MAMRFTLDFDDDALDTIGKGSIKKGKMTSEKQDTEKPTTSAADAAAQFDEIVALAGKPFVPGASVAPTACDGESTIYFVAAQSLAASIALIAGGAAAPRVLVVESSPADAKAFAETLRAASAGAFSVGLGLPFAGTGPATVTVAAAAPLCLVLDGRASLAPFTHVVMPNVTRFSAAQQTVLVHLRRLLCAAKGEGVGEGGPSPVRVLFSGDLRSQVRLAQYFGFKAPAAVLETLPAKVAMTTDSVAALLGEEVVRLPALCDKTVPTAPFAAQTGALLTKLVARLKGALPAKSAIVVCGHSALRDAAAAAGVPVVSTLAESAAADATHVVLTAAAGDLAGIEPAVVIDAGTETRLFAPTHNAAPIAAPRTEWASAIECGHRSLVGGNRAVVSLGLPAAAQVHRPVRSTAGCFMTAAERQELLSLCRGQLLTAQFIAPLPDFCVEEALRTLTELGLVSSVAVPAATFLGEVVSALSGVTVEAGVFLATAAACGLADAGALVAAAATVDIYAAGADKAAMRCRYDPDCGLTSDALSDAAALVAAIGGGAGDAAFDAAKVADAAALRALLLRQLANYAFVDAAPSAAATAALGGRLEDRGMALGMMWAAAHATTAAKTLASGQAELTFVRSAEKAKAPAASCFKWTAGCAVVGPLVASAAPAPAAPGTVIPRFTSVTALPQVALDAALVVLRPSVSYTAAPVKTHGDEEVIRFAVPGCDRATALQTPTAVAASLLEMRELLSSALGLLMLRRILPAGASEEDFVAAIRRKNRELVYTKLQDDILRRLGAIGATDISATLMFGGSQQSSVLSAKEVGIAEAAPGAALDVQEMEAIFAAATPATAAAPAPAPAPPPAAAARPAGGDADDEEDYFAKHGPLVDDDSD